MFEIDKNFISIVLRHEDIALNERHKNHICFDEIIRTGIAKEKHNQKGENIKTKNYLICVKTYYRQQKI